MKKKKKKKKNLEAWVGIFQVRIFRGDLPGVVGLVGIFRGGSFPDTIPYFYTKKTAKLLLSNLYHQVPVH